MAQPEWWHCDHLSRGRGPVRTCDQPGRPTRLGLQSACAMRLPRGEAGRRVTSEGRGLVWRGRTHSFRSAWVLETVGSAAVLGNGFEACRRVPGVRVPPARHSLAIHSAPDRGRAARMPADGQSTWPVLGVISGLSDDVATLRCIRRSGAANGGHPGTVDPGRRRRWKACCSSGSWEGRWARRRGRCKSADLGHLHVATSLGTHRSVGRSMSTRPYGEPSGRAGGLIPE